MSYLGQKTLENADWLLGFDFDGTLANIDENHSVSESFFECLSDLQSRLNLAWGICTGRSLEFLLEGIENAKFPIFPDFLVTQERDIYYLTRDKGYTPDLSYNQKAFQNLHDVLEANEVTLQKVQHFIENKTRGEWISISSDPAGIIAYSETEIAEAVQIFKNCTDKSEEIDYQRNTIYLRFTHKDYCKGTALQYLQAEFSISKETTIVIGDNYNDVTMLNSNVAKYFGGPANSIDILKSELQKTGGFITEANYSEGVTEALKKILTVQR